MATRTISDKPAAPKSALKRPAAPATKKATGAPRKRAAPATAPEPTVAEKKSGAEGLLRAGLKALGNVRNDVVKRQTHVIESLLGVKVNDAAAGFGFKKFEDVFDQRVATALERLGLPDAKEIAALRDEVRQLRSELAALQGDGKATARRNAKR